MSSYLLAFSEIDKTKFPLVGGKAANLADLSRMEGLHVPDGFCITTEAFVKIIGNASPVTELLDRLSALQPEAHDKINDLGSEIRGIIEGIAIPEDMEDEITRHLSRLGENNAYAVRSSATAEDLPTASFAGQQDTYLNIIGQRSILKHISRCWASLFTARAITYRAQKGFDHRKVRLAVVVQKMIPAQAAGVLFTADPITSNRKIVSIDAAFGLGEDLVSGRVDPDNYMVRNGRIVDKRISAKRQVLTDEQIIELERTGRRIEGHFGHPQDIEWCQAILARADDFANAHFFRPF